MLLFLPAGILGLVVASLAAAYMSTISTHLNWGASYIVDDFYKRFVVRDADEHHYVTVGRIITVVLMVLSSLLAMFYLEHALQAFEILLQIGAGTGLLFLLRWFWWRINAWTEISAMLVSFGIAMYFAFFHRQYFGFEPWQTWQELSIGVAITTLAWLAVTFITPKTRPEVLQAFYDKIHPMGRGWMKVVQVDMDHEPESLTAAMLGVFLGCAAVYSALFSTGFFIYGQFVPAVLLALMALLSAVGIMRLLPRIHWRG